MKSSAILADASAAMNPCPRHDEERVEHWAFTFARHGVKVCAYAVAANIEPYAAEICQRLLAEADALGLYLPEPTITQMQIMSPDSRLTSIFERHEPGRRAALAAVSHGQADYWLTIWAMPCVRTARELLDALSSTGRHGPVSVLMKDGRPGLLH